MQNSGSLWLFITQIFLWNCEKYCQGDMKSYLLLTITHYMDLNTVLDALSNINMFYIR